MKFLPLLALVAFSGCAGFVVRHPAGHARFTGAVVDVIPRLVLRELSWEFFIVIETDDGRTYSVYAGENNPGVHTGDRVEVTGLWLPEGVVEAESIVELSPAAPGV